MQGSSTRSRIRHTPQGDDAAANNPGGILMVDQGLTNILENISRNDYILNFGCQPGKSILIGRLVTKGHEPRQVWKEAAISDLFCVRG